MSERETAWTWRVEPWSPTTWAVVAGGGYEAIAHFQGHDAEARARAYHAWLTGPQSALVGRLRDAAEALERVAFYDTCSREEYEATKAHADAVREASAFLSGPDWSTVGPQLVEALTRLRGVHVDECRSGANCAFVQGVVDPALAAAAPLLTTEGQ